LARIRARNVPAAPVVALVESKVAAEAASLRYVSDAQPGIRRQRRGGGFTYLSPDGNPVRDPDTLARIRSLAVPPAWTDVWISPSPHGHLQATGRDARGRKQYRYHARWREVRDAAKFERMISFGAALPRIRRRVRRDLTLPGMPRPKVLATLVRLLETTLIRVGNEEYARGNGSFGLTTFRNRHAVVRGTTTRFRFPGKSGIVHAVEVTDVRLARVVRRCQELPGHELFQYLDDAGEPQAVDSADVNAYLREISGEDFTAKDFRTWAGTIHAASALLEIGDRPSASRRKRAIAQAMKTVAQRLGNTPAICRKCYVHPVILDCYLEGGLDRTFSFGSPRRKVSQIARRPEESALLALLESHLASSSAQSKAI
jgi:DNA topoisomerase-1